jgi:hypothetical protein
MSVQVLALVCLMLHRHHLHHVNLLWLVTFQICSDVVTVTVIVEVTDMHLISHILNRQRTTSIHIDIGIHRQELVVEETATRSFMIRPQMLLVVSMTRM